MTYQPRDFIQTPEGLIFAVVDGHMEEGRVLCWLRYAPVEGRRQKLRTAAAQDYLATHAPDYLYTSRRLDTALHGVPLDRIARHHRPRARVRELLGAANPDAIEAKAAHLLRLLAGMGLDLDQAGLTGSLLIGAQNPASDLDVVIYGRAAFFQARALVRRALAEGALDDLAPEDWRDAYARRGCALGFEDYLWHERRKFNKGMVAGTKFDISLIGEDAPLADTGPARKLGRTTLRARVLDARYAYDCPAVYRLDHPTIAEVHVHTQTYAGQAEAGETVEVAGVLEETAQGPRHLVVGTSREAPGEYLMVVREPDA